MSCSKTEEGANLIIGGMDPDLKAKFKAQCALEKRSMKDVIQQLMRQYISNSQ